MDTLIERLPEFLLFYSVLLFSLSFHEAAHAISAKWGGDHTAAYQGRVTMNPLAHIDPIGTVLMPMLMFFSGIPFLIGWAKPVPVQDLNFRRSNWGMIVALAGPFSNVILAFCGAFAVLLFSVAAGFGLVPAGSKAGAVVMQGLEIFILMNCALAAFNMLPVPPLDGSHVLWHTVVKHRPSLYPLFDTLQQFGFFILMALLALTPLKALLWVVIQLMRRAALSLTSLGIA
ncbi:MAG: site-2 protease family protein [Candidatus Sumerlaeia bacterium]|nr:site-2 protease family protein [Candidatus Sumerlaeia bacterium]